MSNQTMLIVSNAMSNAPAQCSQYVHQGAPDRQVPPPAKCHVCQYLQLAQQVTHPPKNAIALDLPALA